jgi:hypothetical protein
MYRKHHTSVVARSANCKEQKRPEPWVLFRVVIVVIVYDRDGGSILKSSPRGLQLTDLVAATAQLVAWLAWRGG